MLLNGRKETWVKFNPGLSAYRPSNNQERITKQGGQKNAKNTFATAIHTDQGPEKRCGTYKTGPIVDSLINFLSNVQLYFYMSL